LDYDGPVQTAHGPTTIVGGIAGRRIEVKPDNTFHFTDEGREQATQGRSPSGSRP
jgi:hypothetical protein